MNDRVVIDRRFNGPPNSANGDFVCGTARDDGLRIYTSSPHGRSPTTARKHHSAAALYYAGGRALAVADAVWIELRLAARSAAETESSHRCAGCG